MTNIKKIGLSALAGALAMTSAHAGSLAVSGAMEISYTKGSGQHTTGNPLGQANDMSLTASTELDNGVTVAYKRSITDAFGADDSELVFGNILGGTVAFQSTGSPLDGIDNMMPTAFNDAEGSVGSIADVSGDSGAFGIRYTLSDIIGTGVKLDYNYVPKHGTGDATGDGGPGGNVAGSEGSKDSHDIALTGSPADGINVGVGYSRRNYNIKTTAKDQDTREDGTAYVTYATGPVTVGVQLGAQGGAAGGDGTWYRNRYMGISYAVSDDLSIAYNRTESSKRNGNDAAVYSAATVDQEWDNISLSYSMGGMTIGVSDSDCSNCSYTASKSEDETVFNLTIAF